MNKLISKIDERKCCKREDGTETTKTTRAFTLLEMLLVIAMIAILAGIVIVAINPGRQLAAARNVARMSDLRAINSAVQQYYIDNRAWPAGIDAVNTLTEICNTGTSSPGHPISCSPLIDLSMLVPNYISAIPTDPQVTASLPFTNTAHAQTTNGTGYEIAVNPTTQMVMLTAPNSDEYGLTPVQLGTTALTDVAVDYSCGDPTLAECWSAEVSGLTWGPADVVTGATSDFDGAGNTDIIIATSGSHPAAEYCATLDDGVNPVGTWYLPASDQLEAGLTSQFIDGTLTGFTDGTVYFSSTEYSAIYFFFLLYNSTVNVFTDIRSKVYSSGRVRCFR